MQGLPPTCTLVSKIMPKRKRKDREKRYKPPLPGPQEYRDDSEVDEEDLNLLQDGLLEGRFDFLAKLEPEKFIGKGKKPIQPQPQTAATEDDDSDTDPDLQERRQPRKHKRRMEVSESRGEEAEFEAHPRLSHWDEEEEGEGLHYLLPLKTKRGLVQQPAVYRPTEKEESSEEEELSEEGGAEKGELEVQKERMVAGASSPVCTTAALFARRQQKLAEKKQTIAESASMLVESPEENISHLRRLQALCSERDPDVAISTRKLAMLSLMAVFRDIAPSYRIREPTEAEKAVKVSKDVRRLQQFEEALLSGYQQFLTLLDETVRAGLDVGGARGCGDAPRSKRRRKKPLTELEDDQRLSQASMESLAEVALQCLCELAVSLSHFNYRNNTLSVLVPRMTSRALGGKVSQMCCGAIQKLFQADIVGEVSLEAVQLIARMVKSGGYKAKPAVLRTFLHLNLQQVDIPVGATGTATDATGSRGPTSATSKNLGKLKAGRMSRRQKKRLKSEAKLDRELRAAEAEESKERKRKLQTEVIQLVFLTYFRILKHSRHSPLLHPVLEGLAKFSHLINVDFFQDLMSVLHSLAETGGLSSRECMQCVLTAFQILSGQGAALNIDPRHFYIQLYEALLQLDACSSTEDVKLAVQCLDRMMRKRRQVSLQRVLGFVKRLCTISLQLAPGACLAVMATVKQFMHAYSQCDQLLEVGGVAGGVFRAEVPDPEMSQASSTLLWELCLFRRHYDPSQQTYAGHLLAGAPSQGRSALHPHFARKSPCELMKEFSGSKVNPMQGVPPPAPHPAMKLSQKKDHSEFYYSDPGIQLDAIKQSEAVAVEYANRVLSLTSQQEIKH